jgi:hypothetical protein
MYSSYDAARAYDKAVRAHRRDAFLRRLRRRCVECLRRAVYDGHAGRGLGLREIPVDAINATVEPGRALAFDRWFRPAGSVARGRWERLWMAAQRGESLPPISVVQAGDGYAVLDGHHRVSVARARGALTIDAVVAAA